MNSSNTSSTNWQTCLDRVTHLKPFLKNRYPGQYLLVAVHSGRLALGQKTDKDSAHDAACAAYDKKYGPIVEPILFLGYQL